MEISGLGKSPNTSLSFRYNANNEELEELYDPTEEDPPTPNTPLCDVSPSIQSETASPKKSDKTPSIIDKYFKSMRVDKIDKTEEKESKVETVKPSEDVARNSTVKEVSSSPVKDYLNRLSKRSTSSEVTTEVKDGPNETWKIFHDFKFKIAQAVEDIKSRSGEDAKEKSVPRENSTSDSEENSAIKDSDQSVGDTDNQVSSLDSSIQNLSELTQPVTAKANDGELSLPRERTNSESTDDTHKNLESNDSLEIPKDLFEDHSLLEVESGVEALEETNMDVSYDFPDAETKKESLPETVTGPTQTPPILSDFGYQPPPSKNNIEKAQKKPQQPKIYFLTFFMYFLTILLLVSYAMFPHSNTWNGFLLGMLFLFLMSRLKEWVLDNYFSDWESDRGIGYPSKKNSTVPLTYTIPSVKEHRPLKKYEGWINHYRFPDYDPSTYHINKTTTAYMKLEGCNLRISYTKTKVAKRALWDEKIEAVPFYQHRLYNLTGARVLLLPKGLVRKRQWSKKYPICVVLSENEKIQVLEKEALLAERRMSESMAADKKNKDQLHEVESAETNTSPEKKKKFVWRRREKSISHSDGETGREGLRHRLVRKMHRDKKADTVATTTEPAAEGQQLEKPLQTEDVPFFDAEVELTSKSVASTKEDEEDLDETELLRIKEFLEEAESEVGVEGTGEGEWSLHVKTSKEKHSHLYLFARTGRDKHEWFRRLNLAISEANTASNDSSATDDKTNSETNTEKDLKETAMYKVAEKESVSFTKAYNKMESISEPIIPTNQQYPHHSDMEAYEKSFWPYLFKIIQTKSPSATCDCRLLPPEVTWLNTMMARFVYDVMRDPVLIARVQARIQRKLNTLKLPSFMSPLMVTGLSLAGACPLVEHVAAPTWDERGVWLDAELRYDGGAHISILTQINLMKLKEKNMTLEDQLMSTAENVVEHDMRSTLTGSLFSEKQLRERKPAIFDSDVEDSAESSSDDESPPVQPVDSTESVAVDTQLSTTDSASSKKKFLRMVDKIATNKYFQQVTDYKYVKRVMEGLSNTDIKLQLEVLSLEGRLTVNLPPPPHDRLWIGFRTNPQLVLKARPAFGARAVRFAHISNWIEQKLSKEFEKFLVLPNMEDFIIDLMTPTPVNFE